MEKYLVLDQREFQLVSGKKENTRDNLQASNDVIERICLDIIQMETDTREFNQIA